jgi:hypothetical protein
MLHRKFAHLFLAAWFGIAAVLGADGGAKTGEKKKRLVPVTLDLKSRRCDLLSEIKLDMTPAPDMLAALKETNSTVIIADPAPGNLALLNQNPDALKAFTEKGGWLFCWGLTPKGLPDFNKVVGVEHVLRKFECERVVLFEPPEVLAEGLLASDVQMHSGKLIHDWKPDQYAAADTFAYVVDYDDVAPFCKLPDWQQFSPGRRNRTWTKTRLIW